MAIASAKPDPRSIGRAEALGKPSALAALNFARRPQVYILPPVEMLADCQLRAIAETKAAADELDVSVWLRGGWAMDFFVGHITREHLDVDWFCWARDADRLVRALGARGFHSHGSAPPDQQRDLIRGRIGDLVYPIISAAAQIEIKEMMPIWVPGRPRRRVPRAKHRGAASWSAPVPPGQQGSCHAEGADSGVDDESVIASRPPVNVHKG